MSEPKFDMLKFFPLVKVDKATHTVYGLATCESEDKDGEICDYEGAKKAYQEWAEEAQSSTTAAGQDVSLGNIRYMHTSRIVAGKASKIKFDDVRKQVWLESVPAPPVSKDDIDVWPLLEGGFLRGYSQGGRYISRVCNDCRKDITGRFCQHCNKNTVVRYVPSISEVSYVDNPCLKQATFILVKEDGSSELRKFKKESIPTEAGALPSTPTSVQDTPQGDKDLAAAGAVPPDQRQCSCSCAECAKGNHGECMAAEKCAAAPAKAAKAAKAAKVNKAAREEKVRKMIENMLIDTINNRAYGQLNKGMYTVARFADLIESLKYLWLSMEWEEEEEGDESPATEEVMNAYMALLDALVAYTEEQVEEAKEHPLIAESVEVGEEL